MLLRQVIACGVAALTFTIAAGHVAMAQEAEPLPAGIADTVDSLIEKGLADDVGLKFVEDLTTEVGPRLAGSPDEARARVWAMNEIKELNFDRARVEDFTIPYWARTRESGAILGAHAQPLVLTALGGSRATPVGGLEAEIVRFETLEDLQAVEDDSLNGKIAFIDEHMYKTQDGSGYGLAVRKRWTCAEAAKEKGGVACLMRSVGTDTHRMPHTGIMTREGPVGALPAAAISGPDADQINRLLERGPVRVKLDIGVETAEEAPSGNVIAEIEGSDLQEEIVLISCHLDSWDLGTGALDDGAGCGIVVAAAKLIHDLPGKPRRTIRVVLFGAEEVGYLGGSAYLSQHEDDMENHVLAAESDFGAGRIWRFQTRFGEGALPYARAMQMVLLRLGIAPADNAARGGPDIRYIRDAGVPVVTPGQDGRDYFDYHHTSNDTLDKIDPDTFRQNVAVYAAFTYIAAQTGWDFRKADDTGGAD